LAMRRRHFGDASATSYVASATRPRLIGDASAWRRRRVADASAPRRPRVSVSSATSR
jgi:hypothetical protein